MSRSLLVLYLKGRRDVGKRSGFFRTNIALQLFSDFQHGFGIVDFCFNAILEAVGEGLKSRGEAFSVKVCIHRVQLNDKILTLKQLPNRLNPFCSLISYNPILIPSKSPLAPNPLFCITLRVRKDAFVSVLYNRMSSKESLRERYVSVGSKRNYSGIRLGKEASEVVAFMDSSIKKEFESFSLFTICGGERRIKVDPQFESTFLALTLSQKITYYETAIDALIDQQKEPSIQLLADRQLQIETLPINVTKGLKAGSNYKIKLASYVIDCINYEISLNKYLLRRSKKNNHVFIFESLTLQDPLLIRFEIGNHSTAKDSALVAESLHHWGKYVQTINRIQGTSTKVKLLRQKEQSEASPTKNIVSTPRLQNSPNPNLQIVSRSNLSPSLQMPASNEPERSVIEQVFGGHDEVNLEEQIYDLVERKEFELRQDPSSKSFIRRWRKNVAAVLLPQVSLLEMQNFSDYLPVSRDDAIRLYIYQHSRKRSTFRLQMYLKHSAETVARHLCEVQNYKLWNGNINQSHIKLSISSDNAYLVYLKQRAYSHLYRERDFLFVRHLCRAGSAYYLVDASVHHPHFIPFQSIHRATINHSITKLEEDAQGNTRLLMEISADHGGVLPANAQEELTLRFLREFSGLESHIGRFKGEFKCLYDLEWQVALSNDGNSSEMSKSGISLASNLFQQPLSSLSFASNNDEDEFYSIAEGSPRELFQLTEQQVLQSKRQAELVLEAVAGAETIDVDGEGLVLLPKRYLKVKHPIAPLKGQAQQRTQHPYPNLMLKGDFVEDTNGGMKLSNEVKAAAQNNVIKFIMGTIKKNLFSGKGILNISLPVEIFNCDSNIQRLCESLSMAPDIIERRACRPGVTALERFKACIALAFTASVLYFDIDKPFNPILGETFQGFIDGCPVYGEQISHHPPISSVLLVGRGYRIYGNLQAKVYVHLNSGEGVNEGFTTVEFDDGGRVVFQTAPGEVSGLAVGDRKFRFKGKTFVVDAKNRLFCAINFEDDSGIFSKSKWKYQDQMEGQVVRVTQGFIRNFFQTKSGKEGQCPGKKEIEQRLGKVSGRWLYAFLMDNEQMFSLRTAPHRMLHYEFPLNSNSDYREDLFYRKRNDLARSQNEKERLEVLQRNDRKLREKYHPAKH